MTLVAGLRVWEPLAPSALLLMPIRLCGPLGLRSADEPGRESDHSNIRAPEVPCDAEQCIRTAP